MIRQAPRKNSDEVGRRFDASAGTERDLARPTAEMARVISAVANGDLSQKMPLEIDGKPLHGQFLDTARTINTMVDQLNAFANEVTRVAREVGTEGKLGGQADVKGVGGVWKDLTDNVNIMAGNLTSQVRNIAEVTTAVQQGDLSKKITVDVRGEILELKNTVNTMVDQLNAFANEVTRVSRDVGTEGRLGGQADVKGVAGIWKDLTDNVNIMAGNLTSQVRNIAEVTTAVQQGDLSKKITVNVRGEILGLKLTVNTMVDQLNAFAKEVTRVAREVGTDGKLGGQANVDGVAGTWRDLTDNVNQLSATLTTQVRAIAEVATAVTKGDLTRSISVDASGEVANLKDNINAMIRNLRETTEKTQEQAWLKTNLARFARMLQGQRDPMTVSKMILSELAPLIQAEHGVFYGLVPANGRPAHLAFQAGYAYKRRPGISTDIALGQGLVGQCALEKKRIVVTSVPRGYIKINSALGESSPANLVVLPVLFENEVRAVIELASFQPFSETHLDFLDQLAESIGIVLKTIEANSLTEDLLKQSQSLASELQSQQDQLQRTNEALAEKASQLVEQNAEVEQRRREVESAKALVEEKAAQLEVTSRYKSEFLANMSHELRTPLNSLLILAQELAANPDGNLMPKQVEYATIIRSSGTDLLKMINDILDLSKIESGTVALDIRSWPLSELRPMLERTFGHVAEASNLGFHIELREGLPEVMPTDPQRLQQILNNLLGNAFKFTQRGKVAFIAEPARSGWNPSNDALNRAPQVVAFRVIDTGIGIPADKQRAIFEPFTQSDGSTSRNFGGTGLGLSICRDLTHLLGGDIRVDSEPGAGSVFTVYLPVLEQRPTQAERVEEDQVALAEARVVDSAELAGKKALVVDDDIRNIFALTALLERQRMDVVSVDSGQEAIAVLERSSDFDIALVDVMMPSMDGYVTISKMRELESFTDKPIIAVTAKAMKGDRVKCIEAGASDYIAKPVNNAHLLSMIRSWLVS